MFHNPQDAAAHHAADQQLHQAEQAQYADELDRIAETYETTEPAKAAGPLPDGLYYVWVDRVEIKLSKKRNWMLSWTFRVLNPGAEGRPLFHRNMIMADPRCLSFLKRDLGVLGVPLPPAVRQADGTVVGGVKALFEQDSPILRALLDRTVEVKKVTDKKDPQGGYNVYVQKAVTVPPDVLANGKRIAAEREPGAPITNDDIPF